MNTDAPSLGLRERKKLDNQQRILASATKLFNDNGYSQVTTQQIADDAQVGIGTVFRFARSKGELLVYVMAQYVDQGVADARRVLSSGGSAVDAIVALAAPIVDISRSRDEAIATLNMVAFQREIVFGDGPEQGIAADQVRRLLDAITEIVTSGSGKMFSPEHVSRAARAIYSSLLLDFNQMAVRRADNAGILARIRVSVQFLVANLLAEDHISQSLSY